MPVDSTRPEYDATRDVWQKCRDCYDGARAVKARGTAYLPALSTAADAVSALDPSLGMAPSSAAGVGYAGYLLRAPFYNATERTVQGLTGSVFRLPPKVEGIPEAFRPHLEDLTLATQSFDQIAIDVFVEQATVGRVGVLLDMPAEENTNQRPYWVFYNAEQITWWRSERRGGDQLLTGVVLKETVEEQDPKDPFALNMVTQYRHLRLEGDVYVSTIYKPKANDPKEFVAEPDVVPLRRGEPLNFIPFLVLGARFTGAEIDKSPIEDLVEENLTHYRLSADLFHGLHWTALPTPWIAADTTQAAMTIGSSQAWNLGPGGTAGMLEFTGAGLGALSKQLTDTEHHMAVLGAKLLESEPGAGAREAAETVRLRHAGEGSVLRRMATTLQQGLQTLLRWHMWWAGLGTDLDDASVLDIVVTVNMEFMDTFLSPAEARDLMLIWQADGFSYDSLFRVYKRGGLISEDRTLEEELALISAQTNQRALPPEPESAEYDPRSLQT